MPTPTSLHQDQKQFLHDRLAEEKAWVEAVLSDERGYAGRWESEDDAWDELGFLGVTQWAAVQDAQHALIRIKAIQSMMAWVDMIRIREKAQGPNAFILPLDMSQPLDLLCGMYSWHPDYQERWRP